MTVIAYRGGVMAADSGAWMGEVVQTIGPGTPKCVMLPSGTLVGATGNYEEMAVIYDRLIHGTVRLNAITELDSDLHLLAVPVGKQPILYSKYGRMVLADVSYFAIGGAAPTAMGALHNGATPQEAIEACIAHTDYARGPVVSVAWPQVKRRRSTGRT